MVTGVRGNREGFSFETALDVDESVRQATVLVHHQRFVIRLAMMCFHTGRLFAHIDHLRRAAFFP